MAADGFVLPSPNPQPLLTAFWKPFCTESSQPSSLRRRHPGTPRASHAAAIHLLRQEQSTAQAE